MNTETLLRRLWQGWKVCEDPRYRDVLLFSPDRSQLETVTAETFQRAIDEGLTRRVRYVGRPDADQPGAVLTDGGRKVIGVPSQEEIERVREAQA